MKLGKGSTLGLGIAAAVLLASVLALAVDNDELMPGKIAIVKQGVLAKFVAKPVSPAVFDLPDVPGNDPTVEAGSTLTILDTAAGGDTNTYQLPIQAAPLGWKGLGNPPGDTGFKYKGAGTAGDPCKVVIVKEKVVKAVCKGAGITLSPPFSDSPGTAGIILTIGTSSPKRYCAEFGGTQIKNDGTLLKRKLANPPPDCPTQATSTSTSTSSTVSTSTSTTVAAVACCGSNTYYSFKTVDENPAGDCGDIIDLNGNPFSVGGSSNIQCGALYYGGGVNSVPLPAEIPDLTVWVTKFTGCTGGNTATLGPASSTDTGSNRTCTMPGCLYGAPLAIPNTVATTTSTCVINKVSTAASGSLDCLTGVESLDLPLSSEIYLTGDLRTQAGGQNAGIQPCPLCFSGSCRGGPNNGMACTVGTTDLGAPYPTSHDCPPDTAAFIGALPIGYALNTGTISWTAAPSGTQSRVFSGFCRDGNGSLNFQGIPVAANAVKCFENGVTLATCSTLPYDQCEQKNEGAFGPGGGGVQTITAIGSAGYNLTLGPQFGRLVSVFGIPPTFNATVDNAANLPGPGAAALPGTGKLCATASPCP